MRLAQVKKKNILRNTVKTSKKSFNIFYDILPPATNVTVNRNILDVYLKTMISCSQTYQKTRQSSSPDPFASDTHAPYVVASPALSSTDCIKNLD